MKADERLQRLLLDLNGECRTLLASDACTLSLKAGDLLFQEGDPCKAFVLVGEGRVQVLKRDAEGREIVLYRLEPGEMCVLTAACLFADLPYAAEGVAETEVELICITKRAFLACMDCCGAFRRKVFGELARRIQGLTLLVSELAFGRMEKRLAKLLVAKAAEAGETIDATHQALAAELGTAREVVSRLLKDFEKKGMLALARGSIRILDLHALERLNGD